MTDPPGTNRRTPSRKGCPSHEQEPIYLGPRAPQPFRGFTTERVERSRTSTAQSEPAVPASLRRVRSDVIWRGIESLPIVRAYRGYQHLCVRDARRHEPEFTVGLSDSEVWKLTDSDTARTDHQQEPQA